MRLTEKSACNPRDNSKSFRERTEHSLVAICPTLLGISREESGLNGRNFAEISLFPSWHLANHLETRDYPLLRRFHGLRSFTDVVTLP
ncbi:hypothetical protein WN48_00847 [Eufriesea mexicana]|uniref:Uncharacterized protein n=1 Tax=Eufriesea mexicana TaxID=516756 RepID=A0A310S8F8_9HYME|nr:hypothetical protein WN48_00847 [Eufriesea mexicana]